MKHLSRTVIAGLLTCTLASAQAVPRLELTPPTFPAGPDRIESVRKGTPAPFDGQLFEPATALRWANWLEGLRGYRTADRQYFEAVLVAEQQLRATSLAIEQKRAEKVEQDLLKRLTLSEQQKLQAQHDLLDPPWYRNPVVDLLLGVLGTVVIFLGGAVAYQQAR